MNFKEMVGNWFLECMLGVPRLINPLRVLKMFLVRQINFVTRDILCTSIILRQFT